MTRIILSSNHHILAAGLRAMLGATNGEFSLSVHSGGAGLPEQILAESAQVVLVDMGSGISLDALNDLHSLAPETAIVLWVDGMPAEFLSQAINSGVLGVVPKTASEALHLECFRDVAQGRLWVEIGLSKQLLCTRRVKLTPRERQLSSLLAQGLKNKEVAYRLGITEGTVKVYLSRLYSKLGVNDRFDLALLALKNLAGTQPGAAQSINATSVSAVPFLVPASMSLGGAYVH